MIVKRYSQNQPVSCFTCLDAGKAVFVTYQKLTWEFVHVEINCYLGSFKFFIFKAYTKFTISYKNCFHFQDKLYKLITKICLKFDIMPILGSEQFPILVILFWRT